MPYKHDAVFGILTFFIQGQSLKFQPLMLCSHYTFLIVIRSPYFSLYTTTRPWSQVRQFCSVNWSGKMGSQTTSSFSMTGLSGLQYNIMKSYTRIDTGIYATFGCSTKIGLRLVCVVVNTFKNYAKRKLNSHVKYHRGMGVP